jgi:ribosomal protein L3 glutamine methyltransferase
LKTVRDALLEATQRLERARLAYGHGTANALDDAAWLVLHAAGLAPHDLNGHLEDRLSAGEERAARELVTKRIRTRKPLAYLLHEAWLGPHRFYVDERVIVPRSFIAELLRGQTPISGRQSTVADSGNWGLSPISHVPGTVLDLCTGSGCLAILAALQFPDAAIDAADLSDDALAVAKKNIAGYKLGKRVHLVKSDLFSALEGRRYDLIVSNPPYVKASSMRTLPDEYRKEPAMALASGSDGLDHTRRILAKARRHLNPGGRLVVEIGHNRKALENSFPRLPFRWPRVAAGPGYVFVLERDSLP